MALTTKGEATKRRILSVCVKLFLEQGYKKTTVADITSTAKVSNSSFQHYFVAKDGVLTELVKFMFDLQFDMAKQSVGNELPPVFDYEMSAAVQLAVAELNDNLRELYLEAYGHDNALDFIQRATAHRVYEIYGKYQPELDERGFYEILLGTTGMMRGFLQHPCDASFSLEKKVRTYVQSELRVYKVPEDEAQKIIGAILAQDLHAISRKVMAEVMHGLASHYEFSLEGILPEPEVAA